MFFTKYPHPANFVFVESYDQDSGSAKAGRREFDFGCECFENGLFHFAASDPETWAPNLCLEPLSVPSQKGTQQLCWSDNGDFELRDEKGRTVLRSVPGRGFGVCKDSSMFLFEVPADAQFFGMGEKWFGKIELSGIRTKFWNTDVWSDFHWGQWTEHPADPPYCSVPYLAMRTEDRWIGFLLHNPGTTFMETPGNDATRVFVEWQRTSKHLILGSENGEPHLWVLYGDTLADLTRKLQELVGKTPLPPLWSLGFHQSRWGYGGHTDLVDLDKKFTKHAIPCSGLWLDLDYMDGFRIFEVSDKQFPHGPEVTAEILARSGRRIVPIIDPGVKKEPGYRIYDHGNKESVFCKNPEGNEFVGLVWPGETVFPDFTLGKVRDWFASYTAEFRHSGFGAAWVDMNDPSTGPVDPSGMLFADGTQSHALHRNQYALGMQMATIAGFKKAVPSERPFLLSRSGFVGTSKYSAVWTGDNISNEFYLRQSIPTTVGMAISGIPFNGPDVGGFGGNADDELMVRWFQLCMLFPFYRNHSTLDSRLEEPWQYPSKIRHSISHAIRTRYQFLPYLYQLFIDQEERGEAMVRPLIYDFNDPNLGEVNDQCMIGPAVLHAPIVDLGTKKRSVVLPGNEPWFDLIKGLWVQPGLTHAKAKLNETPLYLRCGSSVAVQPDLPTTNDVDLNRPLILLAFPEDWSGVIESTYSADDGLSTAYQSGSRSTSRFTARVAQGKVDIKLAEQLKGFGEIRPRFGFCCSVDEVTVQGAKVTLAEHSVSYSGAEISLVATSS